MTHKNKTRYTTDSVNSIDEVADMVDMNTSKNSKIESKITKTNNRSLTESGTLPKSMQ